MNWLFGGGGGGGGGGIVPPPSAPPPPDDPEGHIYFKLLRKIQFKSLNF